MKNDENAQTTKLEPKYFRALFENISSLSSSFIRALGYLWSVQNKPRHASVLDPENCRWRKKYYVTEMFSFSTSSMRLSSIRYGFRPMKRKMARYFLIEY
jgi:hypothetical protein